jgi:hypothetical protein
MFILLHTVRLKCQKSQELHSDYGRMNFGHPLATALSVTEKVFCSKQPIYVTGM